jgi:aspartate racemase
MHLGLIGGIGPASTVVYYQRLTSAMRALGQPLDLTIVNADANTLVKNNLADDRAAQAEVYADLIHRLKNAGADCAVLTSLGGHFCFDETVPLSGLPLVSAVTPLDAYFAKEGLKTVGLLGTEVVMRTALYGQLAKTATVAPDDLEAAGASYLDMALSGHCTDEIRDFFLEEGRKLVNEKGADAVVLAGTDLGLAFYGQTTEYRVIDALDVHVDLLVDLATGKANLNDHAVGGQ